MTISHTTRSASFDEVVKEMDRRGHVIEALEAQIAALATPSPQPADAVRELLRDVESETPPDDQPRDGQGAYVYMTWETIDALRAALASDPAPAGEAVEPDEDDESEDATRLWWLLHILNACGKHGTYANDEPGEWVAAFCDDAEPTDTFNLACNLKLAICTHNSMDETSRIWISDAGKAWLAAHPAPEDTARLREDLERVTRKCEFYRNSLAHEIDNRDEALRERDDARKALEDMGDQFFGYAMLHRDMQLATQLDREGYMDAGSRAAARSASREGASDE